MTHVRVMNFKFEPKILKTMVCSPWLKINTSFFSCQRSRADLVVSFGVLVLDVLDVLDVLVVDVKFFGNFKKKFQKWPTQDLSNIERNKVMKNQPIQGIP